jgi:hypothetical protein
MVRAFLLTNLVGSAPLKFRVPVNTILSSLGKQSYWRLITFLQLSGVHRYSCKSPFPCADALGDFPYDSSSQRWEGKTLFIKGENSKYINNRNLPFAEQFFPGMKLERLPTGHWGKFLLSVRYVL